jgi:Sulfotransferase domain
MAHLLCVSMPRSGHHLVQLLLKSVLNKKFAYCEYYTVAGCCKSIPCVAAHHLAIAKDGLFMQKSHDRRRSDPLCVPGTFRVVQYRNPVPRALSDYELHLARSGEPDNPRNFSWFLVQQARYTIAFYHKWLKQRRPDFFVLSYEQLVGDPTRSVASLLDFVSIEVDEGTLSHQIGRAIKRRAGLNSPFSQRNVYSHQHASLACLEEYEALVLKYCPGYYPMPYFPGSASDGSFVEHLYLAQRALHAAKPQQALDNAKLALESDPEDPKIIGLIEAAARRLGQHPNDEPH